MLKQERGQFTLEAVLIITVLVSGFMGLFKAMNAQEWAKSFIEGTWKPLQGMIEDGEWAKGGNSKAQHPSLLKRHGSRIGDTEAE
jgi:hypothetical protein